MSDCKVCNNINRYYSTNKGRGGNRSVSRNPTYLQKIYVVVYNNEILRFSFDKKEALKYMRELARFQRIQYNPDYITHVEEADNYIKIIGSHRFFIISYQKTLAEFRVCTVNAIPQNIQVLSSKEESIEPKPETSVSGIEEDVDTDTIVENETEERYEKVQDGEETNKKLD